ncbi:unnamed protein product [Closterium sp. NIES-54]
MIRASLLLPACANPTHGGSTATAFAHRRALLPAPAAASASAVASSNASAVPRATLRRRPDAGVSGGGCCGDRRVRGGGRGGVIAPITRGSSAFGRAMGSSRSGKIDSAAPGNCLQSGIFKQDERGAFSGEGASTSSRESWRFNNSNGGSRGHSSVTVTCSAGGSPAIVAPPDTSDSPRQISILFAAGGTGGHVYPAIAIADAVRSRDPTAEINFVGTKERMEWTAVPHAGYPIHPIPAVSIRRPLLTTLSNLLVPFRFLRAFCVCLLLIWRLKPDVVIGTGGYVSAPTCLAAAICRIPLVLQEQNAFAGIANRLLGRFASVVFVAFAVAQRFFPTRRCHVAGNPTRAVLRSVRELRDEKREEAIGYFFPHAAPATAACADGVAAGAAATGTAGGTAGGAAAGAVGGAWRRAQVVLVLGGSLGAQPINTAVAGSLQRLLDGSGGVECGAEGLDGVHNGGEVLVIWQAGARHVEEMRARPLASHPRVSLLPFVDRMELAYAAADVVVARAGAVTCSELLATATPCILIPSPHVAEDHQTVNAHAMVQAGAAVMLPQDQLSPDTLLSAVTSLLADEARREKMKECAAAAATADAADVMAQEGYCFSLGSGAVLWKSTRSSSVSTSTVEAQIYAGAMAAQELRWLTFLLTDLRELPSSAPNLFTDNKATILLYREPRLESIVKHINVRPDRFESVDVACSRPSVVGVSSVIGVDIADQLRCCGVGLVVGESDRRSADEVVKRSVEFKHVLCFRLLEVGSKLAS